MFEKNIDLLKEANSELFDKLKSYQIPEGQSFQLINAESGDPNLFYNNIPLHCTKNPQTEALRAFGEIKPDQNSVVVLVGMGLGFYLKRFFQDSPVKIVVYEPDLNILKLVLGLVDFSEELKSGRVYITSTIEELNISLGKVYAQDDKIFSPILPSTELIYPEQVKNLMLELSKITAVLQSNNATLYKRAWGWFAHSLHKLKGDKPDYSLGILKNKFRGKTALIVSAGPSLDKNIEIIKNNREKFVVFCVNVAYKKLVSEGIMPDFTVYIDVVNFLDTIKNYEHSKTNIINHFASNHKIFEELTPAKFFTFYCRNHLMSRWVAKVAGFSVEEYETKGSVSHLALLAAHDMGCNPIILTGQDLAYTDGKYYSSGSFWSDSDPASTDDPKEKERYEKKVKTLKESCSRQVKGQNGEILLTSPDYAGFISHFEDFAEKFGESVDLINCSTGGADIKGYKNRNLEEIVNELNPVNVDITETLEDIIKTEPDPVRENLDEIWRELKLFREDLLKLIPVAESGMKYSKSLYQELQRPPFNPVKVKKLTNNILNNFRELDDNLFQKWEFAVSFAFKELSDFNKVMESDLSLDGISDFRDIATVSKALFEITHTRMKNLVNKPSPLAVDD